MYNFLEYFRPELYQLAVKIEINLQLILILALIYYTICLKHILYYVAKLRVYKPKMSGNLKIMLLNNQMMLLENNYM